LRITYDGDPPDVLDVLKIGRRYVKFCAELFGFGRSGITIGNKEVGEPMSWNTGRLMFTRRNAPDELLAILRVTSSAYFFGACGGAGGCSLLGGTTFFIRM